jgi:hypothetical protein
MNQGFARMVAQSVRLTVVANTFISTSSSEGIGFLTSFNCRTSGEPYLPYITAFKAPILKVK